MKKISVLLLCVVCLLFLNGCWDKQEPEDNIFTVLMGIDKAEEGNIIVTVSFPLTQTQGAGQNEGEDNGSGNYTVMSVKAPTIVEGLNILNTKLSGPLSLYSIKLLVISQELASNDMMSNVFSSWRYDQIRNTTNVLISECKANEFIEARIKDSPIDPLRQEELLLEQANKSAYYKPIQLFELLTNLKSNSVDGVAMYGGVSSYENNKTKEDKEENDNKNDSNINKTVKEGYLPSETPIDVENKSQILGLAVFHETKMVGVLNSFEAQTYSMLTQNQSKKILTIPDPIDQNSNIVISIMPKNRNKINTSFEDNVPVIDINVNLECNIECIQSNVDYTIPQNYNILIEHIREICSSNMKNLINKTQSEYNADILKLGDKFAFNFLTVSEWENYNWQEKYKEAQININVLLKIERIGIMIP